ncbi:MAG: hypothetical protein IAE90_06925 [Ignavibacteria bacterium]|nr:hypothetical protein [Ignavibacteria bacterium]
MKTTSDDLFRLIKSLNKSEKGYFKKFAAKNASGSRQNYLVLFDAVDSMEVYDEEKLKKKLKNESFTKQLPVYKVYLFNHILKALHLYGAQDKAEEKLTELIINIKILSDRALYKEAWKLIRKTKEMAYKYDKLKYILEVLSLERGLLFANPDKNIFPKRKEIFREQSEFILKLNEFYEYSWLVDWMTILVDHQADFKHSQKNAEMEKILSHPLLTNEKSPTFYTARLYFYHTYSLYHAAKRNTDKIYEYLKKEINLAEKFPHFIDEKPQNYAFGLINFLLCSSHAKKRNDVRETIVKLGNLRRRLKTKISQQEEINIFFYADNIEMLIYEQNCDLKRGRIKARAIEKSLKKYYDKVPLQRRIILHTDLAYFYLLDENLEQALHYINIVLDEANPSFRSDIYEFARVFQLIVHFELGNYDLLEYLIAGTYKFFKEKKKLLKPESIVLDFFKGAVKAADDELPELYEELKYKLKKEEKNFHEQSFLVYFDFISWAESKTKKVSFIDILKNKKS